jgi:hypothetical protein
VSYILPSKLPQYLIRLAAEYRQRGSELEELIQACRFYVREGTAYDNLDGGTYGHDVLLFLPLEQLSRHEIGIQRELGGVICEPLNQMAHSVSNEFFNSVSLELIDENDEECQEAIPFSQTPPVNPDTVDFWKPGFARVFVSHRDAHKATARELGEALEEYGFSFFIAHDTIKPRTEWRQEIMKGLQTMEVMLAFVTDDFAGSLWCQQEVGFALGKAVPIISFKVGDADPPGFISHVQAKKGKTDNPYTAAAELVPFIGAALGAEGRLQDILISSFVTSPTWTDARSRFDRMAEQVETLTSAQISKIVDGYRENDQLYNAIYLSNRAHRLVKFMDRTTSGDWVIDGTNLLDRSAPPD